MITNIKSQIIILIKIPMKIKDSNISYDKFVLINNVLKEYDEIKEEIRNLKT